MSQHKPLPLAVAVCDGDIQRVGALLDENEPINKRDYKGRTALVLALLSMEFEIARLLLERGADPNLHDARERFPLHLSLHLPDEDLVEQLLDLGARPEVTDRKGLTPLHLAAARGSARLVACLLERGSSLQARDRNGSTPLHLAAANKKLEATRVMLEWKPELEARNDNEETPLFLAVKAGANGVVKLLLDHGANPQAPNHFSTTPLDMAYRTENYEVVGLIEGPKVLRRIFDGKAAATEHYMTEDWCGDLERRLDALRKTIDLITSEPRFNVNRFLEVFDRIHLRPGFVLDYYHDHLDREPDPLFPDFRDRDAAPVVFTRSVDAPHRETALRASERRWRGRHLMDHIEFERSAEGFLQWAVFSVAVHQFHLCWHANYNDLRFLLTPAAVERTIAELTTITRETWGPRHENESLHDVVEAIHRQALPHADRKKLRSHDPTPRVKYGGDLGEARVLTFTKWGGLAIRHVHLRWPNLVDRVKRESVVEYECGVQF